MHFDSLSFGTSPQCAVCREQENTEIFNHSLLRKTIMGKYLVKIKDTISVSSHEVDFLYRIPLMLRQQQGWKFASATRNIDTLWFRKL